jgi:hypothetical protein
MQVKYEPWSVKNDKMDLWGFRITEGEYENTVVSIKSVELTDDGVALDYNYIATPPDKTEEDMKTEEFNSVMEFIMNDILKKAIDEFENRNSNTSESNT